MKNKRIWFVLLIIFSFAPLHFYSTDLFSNNTILDIGKEIKKQYFSGKLDSEKWTSSNEKIAEKHEEGSLVDDAVDQKAFSEAIYRQSQPEGSKSFNVLTVDELAEIYAFNLLEEDAGHLRLNHIALQTLTTLSSDIPSGPIDPYMKKLESSAALYISSTSAKEFASLVKDYSRYRSALSAKDDEINALNLSLQEIKQLSGYRTEFQNMYFGEERAARLFNADRQIMAQVNTLKEQFRNDIYSASQSSIETTRLEILSIMEEEKAMKHN